MANRRTNERDEIDDEFEDFLSDDEELDNEEEDDDEFNYEALSPSEKKKYDKMRTDIETRIVSQIAKGDTASDIYKGLQRVVSKKDSEIVQLRNILQGFSTRLGATEGIGTDVEFLREIVEEMLDDDGRKVFKSRLESHKQKKEQKDTKDLLSSILSGTTPSSYGAPNYGQEDETIKQYRKEATTKLRNFVKRAGLDPDESGLDYGDEEEPLLERMSKLESSIDKVKDNKDDEDISKARRKVTPPKSRTDAPIRNRSDDRANSYADELARGAASIIEQFQSGKLKKKR